MDHALACSVWVALGAATFPLLFFVSAPYGKLVRGGWGAQVDGRLGWFIQEIVSPITLTLAYLHGAGVFTFESGGGSGGGGTISSPSSSSSSSSSSLSRPPLTQLFVMFWWAHYLNRSVVYPLTRSMSNTTIPVVAMAVCFNIVNGRVVHFVSHHTFTSAPGSTDSSCSHKINTPLTSSSSQFQASQLNNIKREHTHQT